MDNFERDRSKGLGLGLAIVRRLTLLLDHPLELSSQVGKGSVFKLSLPTTHAELPIVHRHRRTPFSRRCKAPSFWSSTTN